MAIDTDPSTQQHAIVVVSIVAPIVTTLFVAIRLWTRTFVTHSVGYDDCKLSRLYILAAPLSYVIDTALITLVNPLCWALLLAALLIGSEQLSCIGFSALVGLGVLVASLIQARTADQILGTNHGIGWHTADLSPDRYTVYMKVEDSRNPSRHY